MMIIEESHSSIKHFIMSLDFELTMITFFKKNF